MTITLSEIQQSVTLPPIPVTKGGTGVSTSTGTGSVVLNTGPSLINPTISDYEAFTPISAPSWTEGRVFYDSTAHTLCYYNDNNQMTLNIGQEQVLRVRNTTGFIIPNGTVVYVSGATGQTPLVTPAIATSFVTSDIIGVTTTSISINDYGYVTINGLVNDIDTHLFSDGASVYLSATVAGSISTASPDAPNYCTQVGIILHSHATQGKLLVAPQLLSTDSTHIIGTLSPTSGGTGVANNAAMTVTGSGNYAYTRTLTGTTNVTFPTSGTLVTLAGSETLTNKRVTPRVLSAASYTTDTGTSLNCDTLDEFIVTAQAGALKFNNPTGTPTDGQILLIAVTGTAARALTYDTQFQASTVALPSTTVTTARLNLAFIWAAATSKWILLGAA